MSSYIKSKNNEIKLADAIKEVSKTKEFSSIINNISETIHKLNDTNSENIAAQMKNSDNEYNIENYDSDDDNLESILGAFFMDKDGNNICDCLSSINNNLEQLVKILRQKDK